MTKQVTNYVSVKVEIIESESIPFMNEGYATLFDHITNRVIRTVRGRYISKTTTEQEFLEAILEDLTTLITRYNILASVYAVAGESTKHDIEDWLNDDSQFNDAKWHGDDRK